MGRECTDICPSESGDAASSMPYSAWGLPFRVKKNANIVSHEICLF